MKLRTFTLSPKSTTNSGVEAIDSGRNLHRPGTQIGIKCVTLVSNVLSLYYFNLCLSNCSLSVTQISSLRTWYYKFVVDESTIKINTLSFVSHFNFKYLINKMTVKLLQYKHIRHCVHVSSSSSIGKHFKMWHTRLDAHIADMLTGITFRNSFIVGKGTNRSLL